MAKTKGEAIKSLMDAFQNDLTSISDEHILPNLGEMDLGSTVFLFRLQFPEGQDNYDEEVDSLLAMQEIVLDQTKTERLKSMANIYIKEMYKIMNE